MPSSSLHEPPTLADALRDAVARNDYPGYVYGYPHKKAYRPLSPMSLEEVWRGEELSRLFLYVHVPFCNQRCSFCNLFTVVPDGDPAADYLDALEREMSAYAAALPSARFTRLYIGGGTPTYFSTPELRRLVDSLRVNLGVAPATAGGCIECSPETLDAAKVDYLREAGFRRVSLGVQSFAADELSQVNRRFDFARNAEAVTMIGRAGFDEFNVDLIYGLPGQTRATWAESLRRAIDTAATSLFLYPLYVRPLTGLGVRTSLDSPTPRQMGTMYDDAVTLLGRHGWTQLTMRQFRREPNAADAFEYRCQRDGMVGLGAGARSYTTSLHYSTPWRMKSANIRAVIGDYQGRLRDGDSRVTHGFRLDRGERRRRFVVQSLLFDGVDGREFSRTFGERVEDVFADEIAALREVGLMRTDEFRLTALGVKHADIVGEAFFSPAVRALIDAYEYDA